MDWMFEILALEEPKQSEAMAVFRELQAEFHSIYYNQSRMDKLEQELYRLTGNQ